MRLAFQVAQVLHLVYSVARPKLNTLRRPTFRITRSF